MSRKFNITSTLALFLCFGICNSTISYASELEKQSNIEEPSSLNILDYVSYEEDITIEDKTKKEDTIDEEIVEKINANYITEETIIDGYTNLGVADVTGYVNIYTEPSTESFVFGRLFDCNACEILEEDGDFYKIKSGEVEGYVEKYNILTKKEANLKATEKVEEILVINSDNVDVYSDESMTNKVNSLNNGAQVTFVEKIDNKYKIAIDNFEGYIYASDDITIKYQLPTAILLYTALEKTQLELVNCAIQYIGNPYVWGGTSLTNGTDCSGFTLSIYEKFGIQLNRRAKDQACQGQEVEYENMQPGDLVFYSHSGGEIDHVAIYIGNGQIVHASNEAPYPRGGIKTSPVNYIKPVVIKRFLNDDNTSF